MLRLNREKGVTFLFSTHDPRVVQHARRVLRIQDGKMVPEVPASELLGGVALSDQRPASR